MNRGEREMVLDKFPVDSKFFMERKARKLPISQLPDEKNKDNSEETVPPTKNIEILGHGERSPEKRPQYGTGNSGPLGTGNSVGRAKQRNTSSAAGLPNEKVQPTRHIPNHIGRGGNDEGFPQTSMSRTEERVSDQRKIVGDATKSPVQEFDAQSPRKPDGGLATKPSLLSLHGTLNWDYNPNFEWENLVYHRNGRTFANIRWPVELVHAIYNLQSVVSTNDLHPDQWLSITANNPGRGKYGTGQNDDNSSNGQYRFFDLNNVKRKGTVIQCVKRLLAASSQFETGTSQSLAGQGRLLGIKSSRSRDHVCMTRNGELLTAAELQRLYLRFEYARQALNHQDIDDIPIGELLGIYDDRRSKKVRSNDSICIAEIIFLVLQTITLLMSDRTTESVMDFGRPRPPRRYLEEGQSGLAPLDTGLSTTYVDSPHGSPLAKRYTEYEEFDNLIESGATIHLDSNSNFCSGCIIYLINVKGKVLNWLDHWELELRHENGHTVEFTSPANLNEPVTCVVIGVEEWSKLPEAGYITVTLKPLRNADMLNMDPKMDDRPALTKQVYKPQASVEIINLKKPVHGEAEEVLFAETDIKSMNLQGCQFMFPPQTMVRVPRDHFIVIKNKTRQKQLVLPVQECEDIMRYLFDLIEDKGEDNGGYGGLYFFTGGEIDNRTNGLANARFWQHDAAQFVLSAIPVKEVMIPK